MTDIDLRLHRRTGDVLSGTARNVPVVRTVAITAEQTGAHRRYRQLLGPIADNVVGAAATAITGGPRSAVICGDRPLGSLIGDTQLAATIDKGAQQHS